MRRSLTPSGELAICVNNAWACCCSLGALLDTALAICSPLCGWSPQFLRSSTIPCERTPCAICALLSYLNAVSPCLIQLLGGAAPLFRKGLLFFCGVYCLGWYWRRGWEHERAICPGWLQL